MDSIVSALVLQENSLQLWEYEIYSSPNELALSLFPIRPIKMSQPGQLDVHGHWKKKTNIKKENLPVSLLSI